MLTSTSVSYRLILKNMHTNHEELSAILVFLLVGLCVVTCKSS
jgi:hypothetical protein